MFILFQVLVWSLPAHLNFWNPQYPLDRVFFQFCHFKGENYWPSFGTWPLTHLSWWLSSLRRNKSHHYPFQLFHDSHDFVDFCQSPLYYLFCKRKIKAIIILFIFKLFYTLIMLGYHLNFICFAEDPWTNHGAKLCGFCLLLAPFLRIPNLSIFLR